MLRGMVAIAIVAMLCAPARAETADLRGTWTLVSSVTDKDGQKTEQFGHGARGMMSLDGGGRFMLTIIGPDLPKFASGNARAARRRRTRRSAAGASPCSAPIPTTRQARR